MVTNYLFISIFFCIYSSIGLFIYFFKNVCFFFQLFYLLKEYEYYKNI
jgi:hypothetical protein